MGNAILSQEPFEGTISFIRKSFYDTTEMCYYIKENKVRIEKRSPEGKIKQILLFDIKNGEMMAVDPERKLYRSLPVTSYSRIPDSTYKIIKTDIKKKINGILCYQWRVRNRKINSEIAYWVTRKNFSFYNKLLNMLKHTERIYRFFTRIPGNEGYFPMLIVERTLLRDERERLIVNDIHMNELSESLFRIPEDYAELSLSQYIQ
jgi:hypothetical protein